ncbi:MAG: hypothetical protein MZW92_63160 [Comamonadaceae bacterium]|nr:hypothetical protein [Comamonadaceae bacterium]
MNRRTALPALLLAAAPAFAQTGSSPLPSRCGPCRPVAGRCSTRTTASPAASTADAAWRDQRIATDWFAMQAQVRRSAGRRRT